MFGVGVVVMMLAVGGFGLDLWRVLDARRALAERADAAAAAGANGIDRQRYRDLGVVRLDPTLAEFLARDNLLRQDLPPVVLESPLLLATDEAVTVRIRGRVELSLLAVFMSGEGVDLEVVAVAGPRLGGG